MTERIKPDLRTVLEWYDGDVPVGKVHGAKMLCIFHEDTRPSMVYNEDTQTFKCFVCGVGGDSYEAIKKKEGIEFIDAKRLAEEREWFSGGAVPPAAIQSTRTISTGLPNQRPRVVRSNHQSVRSRVRRRPRFGA